MSQLQVDSISSMGGGHVDGAGLVVQYQEAVNETPVTIANGATAKILTLNFTPKFSDTLILVQGFHSQDKTTSEDSFGISNIYVGATEVGLAHGVGLGITKSASARFVYSYSGSIASWGTTPLEIRLDVQADSGDWIVSNLGRKTSLYVWELAQ